MRLRVPPPLVATVGVLGLGLGVTGCGTTTVRHVTRTVTLPATSASTSPTTATSSSSASTSAGTGTASGSGSDSGSDSGSGSGSGSGSASGAGSGSGSASGSSTTATRSALAGRSPRAILVAAAAALRGSAGYAMRADLLQDHSRTTIALTTTGRRTFDASLTTGSAAFGVISVAGRAYLRGNVAFWRLHSGSSTAQRARAVRLAGHWLQVPATGAHSVTRSLGTLSPGTVARCLIEDHGTLSVSGHATIDGRRAVIVRDAGNAPGSTPSTIAVAADGSPYPLRYDATGATRRGGRVDVCNDGKGDGATGTIVFDHFGSVPAIQAPAAASGGSGGPTT